MIVESRALARQETIRHGFFTRQGGVSGGIYASLNCGIGSDDTRADVEENRRRVAECLGAQPGHLITPYQIHSATVVVADDPWPAGAGPKADAVVTATRGLAIAISTADCTPVLFADSASGVIGAAHAGWRGALGGVLEATVDAMENRGASRTSIIASIGPTISQTAYEVGPEFRATFLEAAADNERYFIPSERDGHAMFDLPAFVSDRLERAGISQVEDARICTYGDPERFYSYRRTVHKGEPDYGRQISAIMLA